MTISKVALTKPITIVINLRYRLMTSDTFTATQIAATLQRSKRSLLESLKQTPPSETKIIHGNEAKAWSKDALPQNILTALEEIASHRGSTVDVLLSSPPPFWRPRYPLNQLCEESIERASLLQRALAPALARLNDVDLTAAEFERF